MLDDDFHTFQALSAGQVDLLVEVFGVSNERTVLFHVVQRVDVEVAY